MPGSSYPATDQIREVEVCVVGAGPAGLSVASALIGRGLRVAVLEAGPARPDTDASEPLGTVALGADNPYPQSDIGRTRSSQIGGTAGIWSFRLGSSDGVADPAQRGCRYAPLDPLDLLPRPGVRDVGWPLRRADLDEWYVRAQQMCGLGPYHYDAPSWSSPDAAQLPLDPAHVQTSVFQFGPASAWTVTARDEVRRDPTAEIITGAAVQEIEVDPDGRRANAVRAVLADGSTLRMRAGVVVLAAGGLENVRLLLLSDSVVPGGLGNGSDQVGRGFMEHPLVRGGLLVAKPASQLAERLRLYDLRQVGGTWVMGKLVLNEDVVRAEGLVATSTLLVPRDASFASHGVQAISTLRSPLGQSAGALRRARLASSAMLGARSVLRARAAARSQPDLDHPGWSASTAAPDYRVFELIHQTEQTPHPHNRVTLSPEQDRFGRRQALLAWRWQREDRAGVARARDAYAQAFEDAGLGRVIRRDWSEGEPRMLGGTHHHMGGTAMSADAAHGVVDADCRVHGTDNLYVAGSSVFPSGGFVNPTLTTVALSLRIGHALQQQAVGTGRSAA